MSRFKKLMPFALLAIAFTFTTENTAAAKQCIYNKSGFVLRVNWYLPQQVTWTRGRSRSNGMPHGDATVKGNPVQQDVFPTLQGRCTPTNAPNYTAVLSVVGGAFAAEIARVAAATVVGIAGVVGTAVICGATGSAGCTLGFELSAVAATATAAAIPNAKEIFLVTTPSTKKYIDVWGTVWGPAWGPGGDIK